MVLAQMWKLLIRVLLLLSCISGMLYCTESNYQYLRLREVSFKSLALLSDDYFWQRVDAMSHRFWPVLLVKRGSIKRSIMSIAPVNVSIKMEQRGFFSVVFEPLEPWFMVFWSGGEWFLSREGRMWSVHHELNGIISQQSAIEEPVLVWGDDLPDPIPSGISIEKTVSDTSIPILELESWKDVLQECKFYPRIASLTVNRREGKRIVEILERKETGSVRILLNDSTGYWASLLRAVDDIFAQSGPIGKNIVVDTTYSGKILVRVIP